PGPPWIAPADGEESSPARRKRGRPPLLRFPAPPRVEQLPDPAALRDVPLVLESAEGPLGPAARRELRDALAAVGVAWATLRPALEAGGPPDVAAAVEAGAGVGLLPLSALAAYAGPAVRFRLAGH